MSSQPDKQNNMAALTPDDYLKKILNARVYDVAKETPLDLARNLSRRLNNTVLLKREDKQPVFSFKLRGAYNKMAQLSPGQLHKGVICASAGNHAQGVALSGRTLGTRAVIVMPITTPQLKVDARVDESLRAATMRNHSVTHLMHKALREVLGAHVQQKGSLVDPDKTRFDFAHNAPVTPEQIAEIERRVNAEILNNADTQARIMDIDSAQKTGAMMLFGEKYGETVRVLDIGTSRELCGGTHVVRTGDIGLFKIVSESGVAAGVRRVEAVTGENVLAYLQGLETSLHSVAAILRAPAADVQARLGQVLEQVKALEKEVAQLKGKLASSQGDELVNQAVDVKGLKVLAARLDGADARTLRETMDKLKDKLKTAVIVLATVEGDKVQLAAGVTQDATSKVKAGELVYFVAQQVGGKGGGKPDMAMAGGTDAKGLPVALASVLTWVTERV